MSARRVFTGPFHLLSSLASVSHLALTASKKAVCSALGALPPAFILRHQDLDVLSEMDHLKQVVTSNWQISVHKLPWGILRDDSTLQY